MFRRSYFILNKSIFFLFHKEMVIKSDAIHRGIFRTYVCCASVLAVGF